jgi:hypothetical protein
MTPKHIIRIDSLFDLLQPFIVGPPERLLEIGFIPIRLYLLVIVLSSNRSRNTYLIEVRPRFRNQLPQSFDLDVVNVMFDGRSLSLVERCPVL